MSTLSLRLPNSLHNQIGILAKRDGVSINQLIASAVAEKVAALSTEEYLAGRAKRADRDHYNAALAKVPDVETAPEDAL